MTEKERLGIVEHREAAAKKAREENASKSLTEISEKLDVLIDLVERLITV